MKHIIGIDAGTNSVGWTLNREEDNKINLIDIGTYIFPIGTNVDDKSNKETTKNGQRRIYRGTKRNLFRYKLRRKKLKTLLSTLGMLPDFAKLYKQKNKYQSAELYKLRAKAINEKIPLDDIGRIFTLLNKYRGFKSNAKKLVNEDIKESNEKKEENKKVKTGIESLNELISDSGARTIGEYFYLMHKKAKELSDQGKWHNPNELIDERALNDDNEIVLYNSRGIRRQFGRYTAREMYQKEFDLIWEKQKQEYDKIDPYIFTGCQKEYEEIRELSVEEKIKALKEFKKTNYWMIRNYCIYYQRPLKSQRKYVANCQFEKNKKVIPVSAPLYQEFRIWKNLSDLRYSCEENDIFNQPLPLEWKRIIANYLEINKKIYISKPRKTKTNNEHKNIIDLLPDVKPTLTIKSEDEAGEKDIKGNLTYYAFYESLGIEKYNELKNKKLLEKLWQHIYMAKDDEWLKDTLLTKWNLNESLADKLIDFELEEKYGSYSAKVISKILPYMREGRDEYTSLVLVGYLKSPDEVKEEIVLKKKITQLKYQELRNPVVEKSVSQVIKIVNAILEKYNKEINQDELEIRIESTRELKKPRQVRERMLREIRDKDKVRQEYADFLNNKREEGELKFSGRIEKYDSLINKFELWLEMGMDKNDPAFNEFKKITKKEDKEKHRLWLECNRICPYTGNIIGLTKLFSSVIEIEHIIPLSRSLDNSFNNKTITFSSINKEKGNRTAYEYMNWKNQLVDFKRRIKDTTNNFSSAKKEQFLIQEIPSEFTNNQLSNTSYIAKYVRKKMMEVSHTVQFTNGAATAELRRNDWKLSDLLDKIRFEEETGIDNIDFYLINYKQFRKDFISWFKKRENSTDIRINFDKISTELISEYENQTGNNISGCFEKVKAFQLFRNKVGGKKDRSDHRHHAIDAFIIACCSPSITKQLSTFNCFREENGIPIYDEYGNLSRNIIERSFDYEHLKKNIKELLVCHNVNQKLIVSRENKHKTSDGIKEQRTFAPQGALHKDGLYGKLQEPFKEGIEKDNAFIKRIPLLYDNQVAFPSIKDLAKVYKKNVRDILQKRIEKYGSGEKAFNKEALEKDPLYMYSIKKHPNGSGISKKGNPLPVIKSVRVVNKNTRNLINLPAKDEQKRIVNEKRYVESSGNFMIIYYELEQKDKKGNPKKPLRDYKILSFFNAVKIKSIFENKKLYPEDIEKDEKILGLIKECPWLKQGDTVILYKDKEDKKTIDWNSKRDLAERLYIVKQIGEGVTVDKIYGEYFYGNVSLLRADKTSNNMKYPSNRFRKGLIAFSCSHIDLNAIKIRISPLGTVNLIGEECF
jgi:CRISPR-associated endonuclease Csn1